jgi:hypothetical protein
MTRRSRRVRGLPFVPLALWASSLGACGAASARATSASAPPSEPAPREAARYDVPEGEASFDLVVRSGEVHVYGAFAGESARTLARFDLDTAGLPTRAAPLELSRDPLAPSETAVAAVAIGAHDLVALCDRSDDGSTRYAALWVDATGAVTERVELGAYPAEDVVDAPCFLAVARSRDAAIVFHGRDSLACPRVTYDDPADQCPGYGADALVRGQPPEELVRVGVAGTPALVGTELGWAWGVGPYAIRASFVVDRADMPEASFVIDADSVTGFVATRDTLVVLGEGESRALVGITMRGAEVLTGPPARDELPTVEAQLSLGCTEGAVSATVRTGTITTLVRAGEPSSAVSWRHLIAPDQPGPTSAPGAGYAALEGRVYHAAFDGELDIVECVAGALSHRSSSWRRED